MKYITKEEALERLMHLCSRSEKCLYDIRNKLHTWNLIEAYDEITNSLLNNNFINEERYSNSFVNDKIKYSKWGKIKVSYHLRMKGIDESFINRAINNYPEEDYINIVHSELKKKSKSIKITPEENTTWTKLYRFAAQRGYESEIVKTFISEFNNNL